MNGYAQWDGINHFRPDGTIDQWGDPHKISRDLLVALDDFRSFIGCPFYITSAHREKAGVEHGQSQHYYGAACDGVAPDYKGTLTDLLFAAMRFQFTGIGLYRDWKWGGKKTGGLHLDVRKAPYRAFWFCYKNHKGKQIYIDLTLENLKDFGVL